MVADEEVASVGTCSFIPGRVHSCLSEDVKTVSML